MSCVNGAEMWASEEKKFVFEDLQNPILGQLRQNKEKYN